MTTKYSNIRPVHVTVSTSHPSYEHIRDFEEEVDVMYAGLIYLLSRGDSSFAYGRELVYFLEEENAMNNAEALREWIRNWLVPVRPSGLTYKERVRAIKRDLFDVVKNRHEDW